MVIIKSKNKKGIVAEKKKAERVDDGRVSEQTWKVEIRNAANKAVKLSPIEAMRGN